MTEQMKIDLKTFLKDLSIKKDSFEAFFEFYNNNYNEYDNTVYKDIRSRLTHLKYFLDNSWWNNRFYFLFKKYNGYSQIIDLGFSIPYLPIYLHTRNKIRITQDLLYVDNNDSSKVFSEIILKKLSLKASFIIGNLEDTETWKLIGKNIKDNNILFTSFETIEHLSHPEKFWDNLKKYKGTDIIISLPIGPKIPSHTSAFEDKEIVKTYLKPRIYIKQEKVFEGKDFNSNYTIYTCYGTLI